MINSKYSRIADLARLAAHSTREAFRLPAKAWNESIEIYTLCRPIICKGDYRGEWLHPWQINSIWSPSLESWGFKINAGFVNSVEVEVDVPREVAPRETLERLAGQMNDDADKVTAYINEAPFIPIDGHQIRAIGVDSQQPTQFTSDDSLRVTPSYESVPDFFLALGAVDAGGFVGKQEATNTTESAPKVRRLLRACEIILTQDRKSALAVWDTGNGTSGTFAQFDVVYAPDSARKRANAYINTRSSFRPQAPPSKRDFFGLAEFDYPFDEKHIATVYFVSAAGAEEGSPLDATWTPYVKHHVFWNLNYATNNIAINPSQEKLVFPMPLAAGVGTQLVNQVLAFHNDAYDRAEEFLKYSDISGRFWTV